MTVNYVPQIIERFKASVVEKILVVDDAYDPPALSDGYEGDLLEVLQGPELRTHVTEETLGEEELQAAIQALLDGELDHEAIGAAISSLFDAYLEQRTTDVDPGGEFAKLRDSSLDALDPLLELLERCRGTRCVRRAGMNAALRVCRELSPDLILMDFFLSPPERTTGASTTKEEFADRKVSIELLKSILTDGGLSPAVILMSSANVKGRAQRYRGRLEGRVTSLRFGFLHKNWIRRSGGELVALGEAADVLMDTSGSLEFGRTLESALRRWKAGANAALEKLYDELSDFDVKDFAYLLRFRLYEDGDRFADYLEWFLGESLRATVDENVEWNTEDFVQLNERSLTEPIEGAHPIPSDRMAKFASSEKQVG